MDQFYNYEYNFQNVLNTTSLNEEEKIRIMKMIKIYLQIRDPYTNLSIIKSLPKFFIISKICEKVIYQNRKPSAAKDAAMMKIWQEIMNNSASHYNIDS